MSVRAVRATAVGAAVFGGVAALNDVGSAGIARLMITGAALAAAASFDLSERRIPNRVTVPAALVLLVLWVIDGAKPGRIAAGLVVAAALLAIGLIKPQAIGMGDAKLALVVALGLADKALIALASGMLLAAIVAAPRLRHGGQARKSTLPLGPFVAFGALIALLA
jgi:prepilin signal peptidase PulO-like enzyme (type II secretory pathway)